MNSEFLTLLNNFLFIINILAIAMILLAIFVVYVFHKKSKQHRDMFLRNFQTEEEIEEGVEKALEEAENSDLMFKVDSPDYVPEVFW